VGSCNARVVAVLIALAITASPLGASAAPTRLTCGPLQVTTGGAPHRQYVRFAEGTAVLATVEFEPQAKIASVDCRANVAGPAPAVLVTNYTGGMHCCYVLSVYTTKPFRRVLVFNNNNIGWTLRQGPDGTLAVVLNDGHFDYYDDLTHIWAPSDFPLAACYRGGRFVECTRDFPDIIRACEAHYSADFRHLRELGTPEEGDRPARGLALGVYVCRLLGGPASVDAVAGLLATETGDGALARRVAVWLRHHAADARRWIASRAREL